MRHRKSIAKLGRTASHRKALMRNMALALLKYRRIRTTQAKAKALRPYVEKLITLAKRGDLHARRQVLKHIQDPKLVRVLFDVLAPRYMDRPGGYTRILKLDNRTGDGAPMAILELVDEDFETFGTDSDENSGE
ncbi:MAG: 50S ribosomal protein L17 [Gemmatimonadetes bacterium]|nr:MAG: 50S ribosomal protein L17 [Gemmatimonadota bacterium]